MSVSDNEVSSEDDINNDNNNSQNQSQNVFDESHDVSFHSTHLIYSFEIDTTDNGTFEFSVWITLV